jgi:hypothetical protein
MRHQARRKAQELRHSLAIAAIAIAATFMGQSHSIVSGMSSGSLHGLFVVASSASVVLSAYLALSLAFLLTRDPRRRIVEELRRGEAWELLVRNVCVGICLLSALALISIVGLSAPDHSAAFGFLYAWALVASALQVGMDSFYLAIALTKVAAHGATDRALQAEASFSHRLAHPSA